MDRIFSIFNTNTQSFSKKKFSSYQAAQQESFLMNDWHYGEGSPLVLIVVEEVDSLDPEPRFAHKDVYLGCIYCSRYDTAEEAQAAIDKYHLDYEVVEILN